MPSSPKQTIAFFGSTGGVTSTSLACALRAGYTCTARKSILQSTTQHSFAHKILSCPHTLQTPRHPKDATRHSRIHNRPIPTHPRRRRPLSRNCISRSRLSTRLPLPRRHHHLGHRRIPSIPRLAPAPHVHQRPHNLRNGHEKRPLSH